MAFLRRGYCKVLHKPSDFLLLPRVDGIPVKVLLKDISCFEEHQINLFDKIVLVYFPLGANIAIRTTFDELCAMIEAKAVQP